MRTSRKLAKLSLPPVSHLLKRTRLFRLLDVSRKRPILWVSGPPGIGKTTLVADYITTQQIPVVWYRVDEGDAEAGQLFRYLNQAVQGLMGDRKFFPPSRKPTYGNGLANYSREYFRQLYDLLPSHSIIVFDNVQALRKAGLFYKLLSIGLLEIPRSINVFFLSRELPPPVFSLFQSKNKMGFLDSRKLKFSLDETKTLVYQNSHKYEGNSSNEWVKNLHEWNAGWPAGITMILEEAKINGQSIFRPESNLPAVVTDYFISVVWNALNRNLQDFLLKTALVPTITDDLATELTGNVRAPEILQWLYRSRFFLDQRDGSNPEYKYHPFFRDYLQQLGPQWCGYTEFQRLIERTVTILQGHDQFPDALKILRRFGCTSLLVQMTLAEAPKWIAENKFETLTQCIHAIPEKVIDSSPWLQVWSARSQFARKPSYAVKLLVRAFRKFDQQSDSPGMLSAWCEIVERILESREKYHRLDEWIDKLPSLLDRSPIKSDALNARIASAAFAALLWHRPHKANLDQWEKCLLNKLEFLSLPSLKISAVSNLIGHYLGKGDYGKATLFLKQLDCEVRDENLSQNAKLVGLIAQASYLWFTVNPSQSIALVETESHHFQHEKQTTFFSLLLIQKVMGYLLQGELEKAEAELIYISKLKGTQDGLTEAYTYQISSWMAAQKENITLAYQYSQKAIALCADVQSPIPEVLMRLHAAYILNLQNPGSPKIQQHLNFVNHTAERIGWSYLKWLLLLTQAQIELSQAPQVPVLKTLREALRVGKAKGFLNLLLFWKPGELSRILTRALEAKIEPEYVQQLIQANKLMALKASQAQVVWPWRIRIHTFGKFALLINRSHPSFKKKVPQRPLALLKILIAMGGRGIPVETLADELWPDGEGDMAYRALVTTISRLRKLLQMPEAILLREGKLSINEQYCWIDTWAFDDLANQAEHSNSQRDPMPAIQLAQQALDLYHGPFLSNDLEFPRYTLARDHFARKYKSLIQILKKPQSQKESCPASIA